MLEFKGEEVRAWVGCFVQVLKANLTDEVDVLARFRAGQRLWSTDAVLEFKRGDASVVLNGVANSRVEQNGVGKTVDPVGGRETRVHANGFGVVPRWVHTEMPCDLLAVGDIGNG